MTLNMMELMKRVHAGTLLLALGMSVGSVRAHGPGHGTVESQAGHSHAASSIHGGQVVMTKRHHVEVAFRAGALQVYLYDGHQKPLSMKGVTGRAKVTRRGGKSSLVPLTYLPASGPGEMDLLDGPFAFTGVAKGGAKVTVELTGLPDKAEPKVVARATYTGPSKVEGGSHPAAPSTSPATHPHHEGNGGAHHHD
jgi:hypothetical protein